jgi:hypothetical protein
VPWKKLVLPAIGGAVVVAAYFCGAQDVAVESVRFDLRIIGESVYEAHSRDGRWPADLVDLEGTKYLSMPYREEALRQGVYIVLWNQDLDSDPQANADRILAYHNAGLLGQGRRIWVCRGDLSTTLEDSAQVRKLQAVQR